MQIGTLFQLAGVALLIPMLGCGPAASELPIPFGALDNPPEGSTIKGVQYANGWALSEDGVDHVVIYFDRTYLQEAAVKGHRDDVASVYPAFASTGDMRFSTELHTESLPVGRHEFSARAISRNGAIRDLPPRMVTIEH